jgi:hypothetical protein
MCVRRPSQLAQTVGENILQMDQRFWMRIAVRNDSAPTPVR